MCKKSIMLLTVVICIGALFGCQAEKYPKITVTANGAKIPYYTMPVKWGDDNPGRTATYMYVFEQNPDMENLSEVNSEDTVTVGFAGEKPDKIAITCEFLTVPYYEGTENTSSAVETVEIEFEAKGNKYTFKIDALEIEPYGEYYWIFTPTYYWENSDLRYIAGRVYKISAVWGENECEYAFVIKNRDDIKKEDLVFPDRTANINVMLERPENWRKIVGEPVISEKELSIIDGSTATVPITAELCRQFFDYSDEKVNEAFYGGLLYPSTTHWAYMNLIDYKDKNVFSRKDLILVTPPSEQERQAAEEAGVELDIAPIAKDGFVFITHKDNPVENLTPEQIQAIYTGKITNWKELGGEDAEIQAYQREPNSGSQTAMEQMVMQNEKMIDPIDAKVISGMGELVEAVAEYENGKASIGYTYYYYINNLYKNENIKVLKINGITPENENLSNESYPFTTNYYAVIRGGAADGSPARRLRDFLVSDEGQRLIEMAGYCRGAD